ncbi:Hormone-sensitive lipase, partial [Hondaea fermentalgiana]
RGAGGDEEARAEEGRGAERHRQVADLQADLETLAKRTREALASARGLASEIVQRVSTAQSGPTPTCVGRKKQRKRAAGVEDRFSALIKELEVLETRLTDLRTWLHEDGNAAYALHLAIAMQYIAAVMGTPVTDLRSRSRIGNERYHVEYDGVTAPQLLQELREDTFIMWYTEGNVRLLRSHVHGLNEVLDMVLRRSASEPDSFIMRVASGEASVAECDFCEVVQGLYDEERAMRSLRKFFKLLMITNAAVHEYYFETHHLSRFVSFVRGSLYYGVFKRNRGQHRGEVTFTGLGPSIEQNLKFIQYVWNLPDKGGIRHFYRSGISNVRHSVAFAISDTVKARFISSKNVGVLPAKFGVPSARSKAVPQRALVLHFHGGGFVSMSAAAHENYTRRWTKQCGVPVISVDYSLSPDAKFPTAVDEAFEAFRWCREVAGKVYGTDRVIVAGDSAGGTLGAAVIIKCILEGYPGPDGALLAYPAVDIRRAFSPSILWSLNDKLLPYTFLLSCLSAYLGTTDPESMLKSSLSRRLRLALFPKRLLPYRWVLALVSPSSLIRKSVFLLIIAIECL